MNSGPGNASGCFIHEKHHNNAQLPRFAGWWGITKNAVSKWNKLLIPFMVPMVGKSVIYPYYLLHHLASVEMFDEIGMDSLIEKKKCYNLLFRIYFARNRQRGRKYF
jgi:kynureninase